jgi:V/A-type H+-transporting ATPase subunit G/H
MAKDKILSEIKEVEERAKKTVSDSIDTKNERILHAQAEAREIIKQAEIDAQKSAQSALKSAKETIKSENAIIIEDGLHNAESIKEKAEANLDKAVDYLISEFERAIHA